jgi:hypothetical protein
MGALRWLLGKDLRILRRSPVLVALLIVYPVAIAVLIGLALSRSPGLPRVAFLNEIPPSQATITLGSEQIDTTRYERQLFQAIQPVPVSSARRRSPTCATAHDRRADHPADLPRRARERAETAYVQVIYNGNAINQSLVQTAIESKLAQANALLATQLAEGRRQLHRPAALRRRLTSSAAPSTCSACATRERSSPRAERAARVLAAAPSSRRSRTSPRSPSTTSAARSR